MFCKGSLKDTAKLEGVGSYFYHVIEQSPEGGHRIGGRKQKRVTKLKEQLQIIIESTLGKKKDTVLILCTHSNYSFSAIKQKTSFFLFFFLLPFSLPFLHSSFRLPSSSFDQAQNLPPLFFFFFSIFTHDTCNNADSSSMKFVYHKRTWLGQPLGSNTAGPQLTFL